MVSVRKPRLVVIPGGLGSQDIVTTVRQAHRDAASRCIIEIYEIIERMAAKAADPELFKKRIARHFNLPGCRDDKKRRDQMEAALGKMRKFEEDFNAHIRANGFDVLPAEKIISTVEQIAHSAWSGFMPVCHGRRNPSPPDSA